MESYQNVQNVKKNIFRDRRKYEMLDGNIYYMANPSSNHNAITLNLSRLFGNYLRGKSCRVFLDGMDVKFSEKDTTVPDIMIVCNKNNIKKNWISGAPDLIVEILSPSTAERDLGYKKDLYEKYGVKEYWIVSQEEKSVQVYLLKDGVYKFDKIYRVYRDYDLEAMTDEEKAGIIKEFRTSLFDDLIISVEEVFENVE